MDLDTTRSKSAYSRLIDDFSSGRSNLLIGTQMVTKGLDFDHVSVVGILNADSLLNYPDFRATEHAFMLMDQVSGRSGRKGNQGLVILQTKTPDDPIIRYVVNHDYEAMYREVMEEREAFNYPPFCHIINAFVRHREENVAESGALLLSGYLRQWFGKRVLGPDKPAVARVKTLSIRKLVIKLEQGIDHKLVREYLRMAQRKILQDKRFVALQIYYDVDPL